jgi:hypothetical protein
MRKPRPLDKWFTCCSILVCAFLLPVSTVKATAQDEIIRVGENVQVSAANPEWAHLEPVADVDPDNPQHLIACSEIVTPEPDNQLNTVAYVSFDGGRSWIETLRVKTMQTAHPSCAFGHGDIAYFTVDASESSLYRSVDGAKRWTKTATYPWSDHPYLTIDNGSDERHGQVYISARNADAAVRSGVTLYRFTDEGKSLGEPVSIYSSNGHFTAIMGAATIMADGTYALMFPELMRSSVGNPSDSVYDGRENAWIKVAISRDGGRTLEPASIVATTALGMDLRSPSLQLGMAADTSNGPFRNRLYVVWQAKRLKRFRILFSYSDDTGKTWSEPVTVDDSAPRENSEGPNDFEPAVAVNGQGVVGVLWYDRRDNPDDLGWYARFTASLDGGDTFLSSVRVSTAPMSFAGRHRAVFNYHFGKTVMDTAYAASYTVGFASGPDGVFHAVWVDNRTGDWQLWTAPVSVSGTVLRNGSEDLSSLSNVSANAPVHIGNSFWDWSTGEFECDLFVKNISSRPITGPLKLRLLRLDSAVGIVKAARVDGRPVDIGSVVAVSQDALKPGEWSKPLHFTARVNILFGPHDPDVEERLRRIFTIDSKTFSQSGAVKP